MRISLTLLSSLCCLSLVSCTSVDDHELTLRDLDIQSTTPGTASVFVKPKSDAEVQSAYQAYLASTSTDEKGRRVALTRLAEIERAQLQKLDAAQSPEDAAEFDSQQRASLLRIVSLHEQALKDTPNAKNNDQLLYSLAQAYEKLGNSEESLNTLRKLSDQYPNSSHVAEAQFRLGEQFFVDGEFLLAESAYSEVIFKGESHPLFEQALMKRGWSRYMQQLFHEAIEDFSLAIKQRRFNEDNLSSPKERDDYNEYFRALALASRHLDDLSFLANVFEADTEQGYIYQTYSKISQFLTKDKRYPQAINVLDQYNLQYPHSKEHPLALLSIANNYRLAEQRDKFSGTLHRFYQSYPPSHGFWTDVQSVSQAKQARDNLRTQLLLLADSLQSAGKVQRQTALLEEASQWYTRYFDHFSSFARQDKVYSAYAELLMSMGRPIDALAQYEKAAYDGDILLDKEAAYATIDITSQLSKRFPDQPIWLDKHLRYSAQSAKVYGGETRYSTVGIHAIELAYASGRYEAVIDLSTTLSEQLTSLDRERADYLMAMALIKQQQFESAEQRLAELYKKSSSTERRRDYQEAYAVAIYQQAKSSQAADNAVVSIQHLIRLTQLLPTATISADALYEAITLAVKSEQWALAANASELFLQRYKSHRSAVDVNRYLSTIYLNVGDTDRAAVALETMSSQEKDTDVQMAALWQAAELYEKQGKSQDAIRAYSTYTQKYPSPYPQYVEAMSRLIELYVKDKKPMLVKQLRSTLVSADRSTVASRKTERTNQLVASAALTLGKESMTHFTSIALKEPLERNLAQKKKLMQESLSLLGDASSYRFGPITTEATHLMGDIYRHFSQALLTSERPRGLSADEEEQYTILLEDEAFPFEEKSIEFYEANVVRSSDGITSPWISQSMKALKELFPSRYARNGKVDIFFMTEGAR